MGEGWLRWVVCSAILLVAYVVMGRVGMRSEEFRAEELSLCGVKRCDRETQSAMHRFVAYLRKAGCDEPRVLDSRGADGGRRPGRGAAEEHWCIARWRSRWRSPAWRCCFLQLDAQFAGFAQILVYIGAVAILVVFAILLTRGSETPKDGVFSRTWLVGLVDRRGGLCGAGLGGARRASSALPHRDGRSRCDGATRSATR